MVNFGALQAEFQIKVEQGSYNCSIFKLETRYQLPQQILILVHLEQLNCTEHSHREIHLLFLLEGSL